MTAAALTPSIEYIENAVTLAFAVPFRFRSPQHIAASRVSPAGVVTTLVYGADYSVTGGSTDSGGTLTVTTAAVAGTILRIKRITPRAQDMDYTSGDTFPAESHESALDKAMLIDQEQDAKIDDTAARALLVPDGELAPAIPDATSRADKLWGFGPLGQLVLYATTTLVAIASTINYVGSWIGAGARSIASKLDEEASVKDFGALPTRSKAQNRVSLQAAIAAVDLAGGGRIRVPGDINYGLITDDVSTHPSFAGVVNDIIIIDFGPADADGAGNKAGAQMRYWMHTQQTTPAGMHDTNGLGVNGDWHPYLFANNNAVYAAPGDPSRTADDNRRASFFIGSLGRYGWRFGQGTQFGASLTEEEMSNLVIEKFALPGDTLGDYAVLVVERKTGNMSWGGGTNVPAAFAHMRQVIAGYAIAIFESLATTSFITLRNSNGAGQDIDLENQSGNFVVNIPAVGDAVHVTGSNRRVGIGVGPAAYKLDILESRANDFISQITNSSTTNGNGQLMTSASAAGVAWSFLRLFSDNGADEKFRLRGDGEAFADGPWNGTGIDYADAFEIDGGNPDNDDWVGFTVASAGNGKVRKAQQGDFVIGAVSGNPSIVGGMAALGWAGKYKRDAFGRYPMEDAVSVSWSETEILSEPQYAVWEMRKRFLRKAKAVEVGMSPDGKGELKIPGRYKIHEHSYFEDRIPEGIAVPEDAERAVVQRRILHESYDPKQEYVGRNERPEWVAVGLIGRVPVRKECPVNPAWIKLRSISDDVDEYLIFPQNGPAQ
jgi:Peptidase_G2, IMC autoproteolytic cleavage domain